MISIRGMTKFYGSFEAVHDLNLEVRSGEVFGFLGPNGAGKTTTIRVLAGLLPPTEGQVVVAGKDVVKEPLMAKSATGFIPDTPFLFERLTGREFIRFSGRLYGMSAAELDREGERQLEFFELTEWANQLIEGYSHGMKKRLAMAASLLHSPEVIIVDEPMVGLDPLGARKVRNLFRQLAESGVTVFLTTHELSTAEAVCDRMAIIHHGRLAALGTVEELAARAMSPGSPLEEIFLRLTIEGAAHDHGMATNGVP
ncbi:MAG: ABC transporter ATP-binding protein [bacterium]|nr:MAG: ABC transporter ATP-binding protein [bacterium]